MLAKPWLHSHEYIENTCNVLKQFQNINTALKASLDDFNRLDVDQFDGGCYSDWLQFGWSDFLMCNLPSAVHVAWILSCLYRSRAWRNRSAVILDRSSLIKIGGESPFRGLSCTINGITSFEYCEPDNDGWWSLACLLTLQAVSNRNVTRWDLHSELLVTEFKHCFFDLHDRDCLIILLWLRAGSFGIRCN